MGLLNFAVLSLWHAVSIADKSPIFASKEKRAELTQDMEGAGKTGCAESDSGAWKRHCRQLQQPQPKEWKE
ncbi:MAG: hypothetical protein WC714_28860 [Candidatus Obscuribacterales bacterium]|jgi:hypothetical protein